MSQMCKVLEEMCKEEREEGRKEGRQEGRQEGIQDTLQLFLKDGTLTLEKIAEITHLPLEEVKRLQRGQEQTI